MMGDINNPKNIDNKNELIAYSIDRVLAFLKKHYWKLILVILGIGVAAIPFIFIFKAYFGGK